MPQKVNYIPNFLKSLLTGIIYLDQCYATLQRRREILNWKIDFYYLFCLNAKVERFRESFHFHILSLLPAVNKVT